jgi:hypothetical protein
MGPLPANQREGDFLVFQVEVQEIGAGMSAESQNRSLRLSEVLSEWYM